MNKTTTTTTTHATCKINGRRSSQLNVTLCTYYFLCVNKILMTSIFKITTIPVQRSKKVVPRPQIGGFLILCIIVLVLLAQNSSVKKK